MNLQPGNVEACAKVIPLSDELAYALLWMRKPLPHEQSAELGRARNTFRAIELAAWGFLLAIGVIGAWSLKHCSAPEPEVGGMSGHLFVEREWQMVFGDRGGRVLLDATILNEPVTANGLREVCLKRQSERGGFSGVFIADGERVVLEAVPLSTFYAISVEDLMGVLMAESLCLDVPGNICLTQDSRRRTLETLEALP